MKITYQLTKYVPDTGLFCFNPKPWVTEFIDNVLYENYGLTHVEVYEGKEALEKASTIFIRRGYCDCSFNVGDKIQLPQTIDSRQFKFFAHKHNNPPQLSVYCHYHNAISGQIYPIKLRSGLFFDRVQNRITKESFKTTGNITQYVNNSMTEYDIWNNLIGKTLIITNVLEVPIIKRGFGGVPDRNTTYHIYTINVEETTNPIQDDIEVRFHHRKEILPTQETKSKFIGFTKGNNTNDTYKTKQQNETFKSKSATIEPNYVQYDSQVRIVLNDIEHLNEQLLMLQTMVKKGEDYCKENNYIFQTLCESTSQLYNKFLMDLSKVSTEKIPHIIVPWIDKTKYPVTFWNNAYYMFIKDLFDKL